MQTNSESSKKANDQQLDFESFKITTDANFKAIAAILDAAEILTALERAPAHHDTHPSHNIKTGGGYAHGRRVFDGTIPNLLAHAHYLASDVDNELGCFLETLEEQRRGQQ